MSTTSVSRVLNTCSHALPEIRHSGRVAQPLENAARYSTRLLAFCGSLGLIPLECRYTS
jgi:hypothetical protein